MNIKAKKNKRKQMGNDGKAIAAVPEISLTR